MTLEEARQEALLAAAKKEALSAGQEEPSQLIGIASGFNKELIGAAGFFPDVVAKGLKLAGIDVGDPALGTEQLTRLSHRYGLINPEGTPEGPGERAGKMLGATTLMAAPVMKAGQAAPNVIRAGKNIFEPIIQSFRASPKKFVAGELASAGGAVAGGEIARSMAPEGANKETWQIIGELAGGAGFPVAGSALENYWKYAPTPNIIKNVFKIIPPVRIRGKTYFNAAAKANRNKAAEILQGLETDAKQTVKNASEFEQVPGTDFTFAELSGDDQLLLFQKSMEKASPQLAQDLAAKRAVSNQAVKDALKTMKGEGNVQTLKDFYETRFEQLKGQLDDRLRVAGDNSQRKIEALRPEMRRSDASEILNTELRDAVGDARQAEKQVWGLVDDTEQIGLNGSRETYKDIVGSQTNIPGFVKSFLKGKKPKIRSVKDVKEFRTRVNRARDMAARAGDWEQAHFLGEIDSAILSDMQKSAVSGEVNNAIAFSREFNARFTKGRLGQILRYTRGGPATSEQMMSEKLFPANPIQSSEGVQASRFATTPIEGQNPEEIAKLGERAKNIFGATGEVIKNRIFTDTGEFNQREAKRILETKGEFLDHFPTLRTAIKNAVDDINQVDNLKKLYSEGIKSVTDARKTALGVVLKAGDNPEKIMPMILNSQNRSNLLKQAVHETSGNNLAFEGLQESYLDELFKSGMTTSLDANGKQIISGRLLAEFHSRFFKDIRQSHLFNEQELKRLEVIIKNAARLDNVQGSTRVTDELLKTHTGMLQKFVGKLIGSHLGSAASKGGNLGSGLIMARGGVEVVENIVEKLPNKTVKALLAEAVRNPEMWKDLMQEIATPEQAAQATSRLNAWLAALGQEVPGLMQDTYEGMQTKDNAEQIQ